MGFMSPGGEYHESRNASHWLNQKQPSFTSPTLSKNNNWETVEACMSKSKEDKIMATGRVNAPCECWGCTNSPRYHVDMFQPYINFPNKMDPDVAERVKRSIK